MLDDIVFRDRAHRRCFSSRLGTDSGLKRILRLTLVLLGIPLMPKAGP